VSDEVLLRAPARNPSILSFSAKCGEVQGEVSEVRRVAIEALGEAMDGRDVRFLAERLAASPSESEIKAVVAALGAAARRASDRDGWAATVVAVGESAGPAARARFLEALRAIGGPTAAGAVAARARDPDPVVRADAIAVLGRWPDEAGPRTLIELVKASGDPTDRLAALRGWCDRVRGLRFSKEARLALCREGLEVARDAEERKVAIFACRGIPAAETMEMLFPLLGDPAVADEACAALVGMSQRVIRFQPEMVVRGMRLVLGITKDEELRKVAGGLLRNAGDSP
jgi:hypothetical protein